MILVRSLILTVAFTSCEATELGRGSGSGSSSDDTSEDQSSEAGTQKVAAENGYEEEVVKENEVASSRPQVNTLTIGGVPAEGEASQLATLSTNEALGVMKEIHATTQTSSLNLGVSTTAQLTEDECDSGIFCIVAGFSDIYDMVTESSACAIKLLLKDKDGNFRPLKRIPKTDIFFTEGFSTIAINDLGGVDCPTHEAVLAWQNAHDLRRVGSEGDNSNNEEDESDGANLGEDEEFFLPARLVVFRQNETYWWRVVMFPKDYIATLATKFEFFESLIDEELDFITFHGVISTASSNLGQIENAKGEMTIDFDEVTRMMTLLNSLDNEEPDDSLPSGKILLQYDNSGDLKHSITTFLDGFSFGDDDSDDPNPFSVGKPTHIYRSGQENYMHFQTLQSFIDPDDPDPGPFGAVQYCAVAPGSNSSNPIWETSINQVPKSAYLPTPAKFHLQFLWHTDEAATSSGGEPDSYAISYTALQGGPYIYGNTDFRAASKPGSVATAMRIRAPVCDGLTKAVVDAWAAVPAQHGGPYHIIDSEGFRNMYSSEPLGPSSNITWVTREQILTHYPSFSKFKFVDITNANADPVIR